MEDNSQIAFNVNVKVEKIEDENTQETNEINENTDNICTVNTRDNKKTFYTQVISIDDSEDENTNSATEESICNREDNLCEFPSSSGIHNETSNDLENDKKFYIIQKNTLHTLTKETIFKGIEEQSRLLEIKSDFLLNDIIRNYHQKYYNPTRTIHENLLDKALELWKNWYNNFPRVRNTPVLYKCYICNKGWWRLDPFRQHIIIHKHPNLIITLEEIGQESNIIASIGFPKKNKLVTVNSNCWKCNKPLWNHALTRYSPEIYSCKLCKMQLYTCLGLSQHETTCKVNLNDSTRMLCTICTMYYSTEDKLYRHMILYHSPKSDEPAITNPKICNLCEEKFYISSYHDCPKRPKLYKCQYCWNKYISKTFLHLHMSMNKNFSTCLDCLKKFKQCYLIEHLLHHSRNYQVVQYCLKCKNNVLYLDNELFLTHMINHGNSTLRRRYTIKTMLPLKCIKGEIADNVIPLQIYDKLLYKYLADVEYMNYSPIKIIALIKRNKSKLCIEDYKIKKTTEKTYTEITNEEIQNTPEHDETEATETNNIIKNDADSDYEPDSYAIETQLDAEIKRDIEIEEQISKVFKASKCYKKFLDKEASDPIEDIYDNDVCIIVKNEETLVISDSDDEKTLELNDGKDKGNPNIDMERVGSDVDILESNFNNVTVKIENCDFNEEKSNNSVEFKHEYVESMKHIKKEDSIKEEYEDVTDGVMDFFNGVNLDFNTNVKSETCTNECDIDLNDWKINEISSIKKRKIVKNTKRTWKYDLTTYFCSDCTYKGCYKDYINHLTRCKKKHPNCTYCKKTFDNIDEYLTHFTEHKLRYLSCPQCLKNFTLLRYLNNHIILHINELFVNIPNEREQYIENKPYICLLCEELVDIDNFFTHWESHLELNEGGVADEMSDGEGDMKSMMSPEMVEQALEILLDNARNSKNKVCIVCSKNFSRKNDSKRHLIEHLLHEAKVNIAETNAKLRCPMCNVDIRELPAWRQHMRDHAQLKVYRCSLCPKKFCDSSNYSKHRKVHNQHKYICDLCGGKFCAKSSIIKHLAVHEPMNPMSCTECNKTLCSEYALKRHMRVRHSMYQFACPVCKRKFGTCKQRWDHMWNKHKIRKFVADCPICNKQYRRIIDVKNHMKSEHGIKKTEDFYKIRNSNVQRKKKAVNTEITNLPACSK
ncbi:PREDICTED: uncharacterized protein LOC106114280 [Papilio xuthus]|uniref:Uncharacterized protein LOC106114280 n=1 Tax=Papilio xuthus TaxID=66420 RepID=A0AAJ6Z0T9_PAPXU|nr:PREDICTED: uncharacterized protein LOC106114280 [Papilio xuthus]XP_013162877.1 PREDICTED: uncharacterized protein LOC106114280 [Papilio xuthus]